MIHHYHGVPIFYGMEGKGPALVLLHGFLESSTMWEALVPSLARRHTIIYMDLPGHGKSGVVGEVHSMELMADVLKDLLTHLSIGEFSIVGHSMGGYVALAFAEKYAQMLRHLILLNSTTYADSDDRKKQRERALRFIGRDKETIIRMAISNLFHPEVKETYAQDIEKLKKEAVHFPTEGIKACIRGMKERPDRTHVLKEYSGSKTIVCGDKDPIVPLAVSKEVAIATESTLMVLRGSHMSWIENRDEIVKIVYFIE